MKKRLTRAQKRERTYEELVSSAERLFTERGFHASTVDEIALEAGYTKGAVYSNFSSKEDLFFAIYERRSEAAVERIEAVLVDLEPREALERLSTETIERSGRDDGWLAVFYEFWAHVIRNPDLRERFGAIHARAQAPILAAIERFAAERGIHLAGDAEGLVIAANAMEVGLGLERLTRPDA